MNDEGDIIVTGTADSGNYGGGPGGGGGTGNNSPSPNPQLSPDSGGGGLEQGIECTNVKHATTKAPDNATYYLPAALPDSFYGDALKHISDFSFKKGFNEVKNEIVRMYTDRNYQFFVDFKRWGDGSGPDGSVGGGMLRYHSEETGSDITAPAFEPFGNFFFGVVCTYGGFSTEATQIAAAVSSAEYGGSIFDNPEDRPHVNAGIAAAQRVRSQTDLKKNDPSVHIEPLLKVQSGC